MVSHLPTDSMPAHDVELMLYCHAESDDVLSGRWQFSLQDCGGEMLLQADDHEGGDLNRLALWSAVRGLEAIDGARSLTLLSSSRYLIRSMTDSLPRWRTGNFVWEHFGRYVEVQNADLWRRVDRALSIHQVAACLMQTQMVSPPASQIAAGIHEDAIVRVDAGDRGLAHAGMRAGARRRSPGSRSRQANANSQPSVAANTLVGESPLRRMLADKVTPPSRRFTAAQLAAS